MNDKNAFITHPADDDRPEVAALWQEAFHDSEAFVDMFFERVYRSRNTLVVKRNGRIVAALQMIPYTLKVGNTLIPSAYVCGVCTHPSERGQGLMTQLMNEATNLMRQRKYGVAILIPAEAWLFDCYRKFGYIYPVNRAIRRLDATVIMPPAAPEIRFASCTDAHFPYFNRKQRERACALLHDGDDFLTIICDLTHGGGNAWVALEADNPVGIIFAQPQPDAVVVKEIFYDGEYAKDTMLRYVAETYNVQTIKIHAPTDAINIHPYGLACILDANNACVENLYMSLMLD